MVWPTLGSRTARRTEQITIGVRTALVVDRSQRHCYYNHNNRLEQRSEVRTYTVLNTVVQLSSPISDARTRDCGGRRQ